MGADISKHDVVKKKEKVFRTNETCAKLDVVYCCSICDNSVMVYYLIYFLLAGYVGFTNMAKQGSGWQCTYYDAR